MTFRSVAKTVDQDLCRYQSTKAPAFNIYGITCSQLEALVSAKLREGDFLLSVGIIPIMAQYLARELVLTSDRIHDIFADDRIGSVVLNILSSLNVIRFEPEEAASSGTKNKINFVNPSFIPTFEAD
jgi:hypothetical protein